MGVLRQATQLHAQLEFNFFDCCFPFGIIRPQPRIPTEGFATKMSTNFNSTARNSPLTESILEEDRSWCQNIDLLAEQSETWIALDRAIENKELVELHTHLLGMGSANFWVHRIMLTYLPRISRPLNEGPFELDQFRNHLKELFRLQLYKAQVEPMVNEIITTIETGFQKSGKNAIHEDVLKYINASKDPLNEVLNLYTDDVVYDCKTLFMVFGLEPAARGSVAFEIELARLQSMLRCTKETAPRDYIIHVARERQFKMVFGIRNSHLIHSLCIDSNDNVSNKPESPIAYIKNAFSMLGRNGDPAQEPDLDLYRGGFTPHFYPNRFRMKDCIYGQRLEVLSILINQTVARYDRAGVKYVEFSMGINDLTNPDVFKHLIGGNSGSAPFHSAHPLIPKTKKPRQKRQKIEKPQDSRIEPETQSLTAISSSTDSSNKQPDATWRTMTGMYDRKPNNFIYGFLAGFGRELYNAELNPIPPNQSLEKICNMAKDTIKNTISDKWLEDAYPKIFAASSPLKKLKSELKKAKGTIYTFWKNNVVGLDWFGDELGAPYCAFAHSTFIGNDGIVNTMRNIKVNGLNVRSRFGIRVHSGEGLPVLPLYEENSKVHQIFNNHISIVLESMKHIWNRIGNKHKADESNLERIWQGVRIGHGVAFLENHHSLPAAEEMRLFLSRNQIVCELNMTSNAYLLKQHLTHSGKREGEKKLAVRQFLDEVYMMLMIGCFCNFEHR